MITGATVPEDAAGFIEPVGSHVAVGEKLTATFEPVQRVTEFVLPVVAATKAPGTTYRVKVDDTEVYGPAPIPPTDIDDLGSYVDLSELEAVLSGDETELTFSVEDHEVVVTAAGDVTVTES